jgi:hypothetical protein
LWAEQLYIEEQHFGTQCLNNMRLFEHRLQMDLMIVDNKWMDKQ